MINYRALILTAVMLVVFVAVVVKLFNIQIANKDFYSLMAEKQQYKPREIKAERGTIKDVNGEVLCFTRDNTSFFVDTRMMDEQKVDSISRKFSDVFDKPQSYYKEIIENGIRNVCIGKKIGIDKASILKKVFIEGLFYEEDFSREYPYGGLAAHVLGYVNNQMHGVEGIEKIFDKELTGTDGNYVFERDVLGRNITIDENQSTNAKPGNDIILTLNKAYQKILDDELYKGVKNFEADSAVAIIMNPNTGELLALSNYPDFDPENMQDFPIEARRNRAITDTYEPGSTIKSLVLSILFDQKLVKENEIVNTENGKYFLKKVRILDDHAHEYLTVREVLEQSSNIGMTKLSTRIQDNVLYKYLRDFGFGNPTSIELPGEASGILVKPGNSGYTQITKAFLSFGYGVSVTPLQLITAYSALINGGILYKPYLVKSINDYRGNVVERFSPEKIRNVISKSTSDLMKDIMIGVVEEGTGIAAQLDNVMVGGKTGTSQMLENGGYTNRKHNSSFVGFFPAEHPEIICLVVVFAPRKGGYGGLVAAPIFHNIAEKLLDTDLNLAPNRKKITREKHLMDELLTDMKSSPNSTIRGYWNVPDKSKNKPAGRKFFTSTLTSMPSLLNQSVRDAMAQMNELGLEYKIIGTGKVVAQSIEAGSPISKDSVCLIKCEPSKKLSTIRMN